MDWWCHLLWLPLYQALCNEQLCDESIRQWNNRMLMICKPTGLRNGRQPVQSIMPKALMIMGNNTAAAGQEWNQL